MMRMNIKRKHSAQRQLSRFFAGISGILITASIAVAIAPPVHARDVESVSRAVSFADLDLARERDVKRLERRIRLAARQLCTSFGVGAFQRLKETRRCSKAAANDALQQMNRRVALHRLNERLLDRPVISMR